MWQFFYLKKSHQWNGLVNFEALALAIATPWCGATWLSEIFFSDYPNYFCKVYAEVCLGEVVTGFRPLYMNSAHMMLTIISLCEDLSLFVYGAKQMPGILETTKIGGFI